MGTEQEQAVDARGVPIQVGATVIYGAPVGRSIALVEGVVDGFTDSGRVWVKVTRRAYGSWASKERVHVGPDRIAQVLELPASPLPTQREDQIASLRRGVEHYQERVAELEAGAAPRTYESLESVRGRLAEIQAELAKLTEVCK